VCQGDRARGISRGAIGAGKMNIVCLRNWGEGEAKQIKSKRHWSSNFRIEGKMERARIQEVEESKGGRRENLSQKLKAGSRIKRAKKIGRWGLRRSG